MSSLLRESLEAHAERLEEAAGECVTYARGPERITLNAVRIASDADEIGGDVLISSNQVDWRIQSEDLVIDGAEVEPKRGDQIITSDAAVFEVFPIGNNEHWRWSDVHQFSYRIHTVRREPGQ